MAYHPRRFPRIPSVRILSTASFLDCFRLLSKTFSRPFSILCFLRLHSRSTLAQFSSASVPITSFGTSSFSSHLPWRLPGVCSQTATLVRLKVSRFNGFEMYQRKREQSKHRSVVRQTKCISFSYNKYCKRLNCFFRNLSNARRAIRSQRRCK